MSWQPRQFSETPTKYHSYTKHYIFDEANRRFGQILMHIKSMVLNFFHSRTQSVTDSRLVSVEREIR